MATGGTSELITLATQEVELGLVPKIGGAVSHFLWRGRHMLRPLSNADASENRVLGAAMFPMVPIVNRVSGNAFTAGGRRYTVQPNVCDQRFHVHGTGWQNPWHVVSVSRVAAELALNVQAGEDPFNYCATEQFRLLGDGFEINMELTNTGAEAMPMGMGQHPWFNRSQGATIEFFARNFYLEGPDYTSGLRIALPAELDFSNQRSLPAAWLNNDFGGWKGSATIRLPAEDVTLSMAADPIFGHLMVYSDPSMPFFCLEPQSHAAGALNRPESADPDSGLVILGPGESLSGAIRFQVREGLD